MKLRLSLLFVLFVSIAYTQVDTGKVYTAVEQMPQFPGGKDSLNKYLLHFIPYQDTLDKQATVFVKFVVTTNGTIASVAIINSSRNRFLDSLALSYVKRMPKWSPGMQGGQAVNVSSIIPVHFLKEAPPKAVPEYLTKDGDTVFSSVEKMPVFKQGNVFDYVVEHLNYPREAFINNIGGVVLVSFVINKDGSVGNVRIQQGIEESPEINQEAARVIFTMPKWEPAVHNGKNVKIHFVLPIPFSSIPGMYYRIPDSTYVAYGISDHDSIYTSVDNMPVFAGNFTIDKYISDSTHKPKKEMMEAATGHVTVAFVNEKNGTVNLVQVIQGAPPKAYGLNDASAAVMARMPKWKPGTMNGKPVRVRFNQTIHYRVYFRGRWRYEYW